MTSWFAPPCRRPHSAQIPDEITEYTFARLEPTIRTADVLQFCS